MSTKHARRIQKRGDASTIVQREYENKARFSDPTVTYRAFSRSCFLLPHSGGRPRHARHVFTGETAIIIRCTSASRVCASTARKYREGGSLSGLHVGSVRVHHALGDHRRSAAACTAARTICRESVEGRQLSPDPQPHTATFQNREMAAQGRPRGGSRISSAMGLADRSGP